MPDPETAPEKSVVFERVRALVGREFLAGDWITVTAGRIRAFAEASGDSQWIHTDEARAARELPEGRLIAHGYLVLTLLPSYTVPFFRDLGVTRAINYGCDKVRFPAPVLADMRIRPRFTLRKAAPAAGGLKLLTEAVVEAEGGEKPVCYAETLSILFAD